MRSLSMTAGALARQLETANAAKATFKRLAQAQVNTRQRSSGSSSCEERPMFSRFFMLMDGYCTYFRSVLW